MRGLDSFEAINRSGDSAAAHLAHARQQNVERTGQKPLPIAK